MWSMGTQQPGPTFAILPCECGLETTLPLEALRDITQRQRQSPKDGAFVNFVCPHCGLGARHLVDRLEYREATSFPILFRPPMFHASLKCDRKPCDSHAIVHTLAESDKPN